MAKVSYPSSWGTIRDPETDERVPLEEEMDDDVAMRLADEYPDITAELDEEDTTDDSSYDRQEWLDRDFQDRADAVESGEVDEHLDEIESIESSDTVLDAIEERR